MRGFRGGVVLEYEDLEMALRSMETLRGQVSSRTA